jgi:hypothetical protein
VWEFSPAAMFNLQIVLQTFYKKVYHFLSSQMNMIHMKKDGKNWSGGLDQLVVMC